MGVGDVARRAAPLLATAAGGAALGGAVSYGAISYAGNSEGGTAPQLVSMLGTRAILAGGIGGFTATAILGRTPFGRAAGALGGLLAIPAGVGGAMLGGMLARRGLEAKYPEEYATGEAAIDDAIEATRDMFRDAGASEQVLDRVPETYDRAHLNASYQPPMGPFGDSIRVGRAPDAGGTLAIDDVVAHEFSHKVIHEYAPGLMRPLGGGDGRAIHESLADTFAMAVDTEDWLLAEDAVDGGMRSFSHPEELGARRKGEPVPAPITRTELERSTEEHLGAGVGNKAAWRIGDALGRQEMVRIYVAALERRDLQGGATFADLADAVRAATVELHGAGSPEARVVDGAWTAAGY